MKKRPSSMWMFLKPGINDDNLGWPFTKKVAFTLEAGGKKIEKVIHTIIAGL